MNHSLKFRIVAVLAVLACAVPALAQQEVSMTFLMEGSGQSNEMTATLGGEKARLDMGPDASMIWSADSWIMVQHPQRTYMEFDQAMLERMRSMMGGAMGGQMPDMPDGANDVDPSDFAFETTGNTDTVMGVEVFEVRMTGPDGKTASVWMNDDLDFGLFEVMAQLAERLSTIAGPMMGGGANPAGQFQDYMRYARAQGMPAGVVLKLESNDGVTITAQSQSTGPFGADTWQPGAGYTKQALPFPR